eukprot:CAMPEP_0170580552 /NCGR_PEP_ID=MMETSP0224-20130122/6567_1 /TAXON_ID=285029 /ORGANISM="Togula jolla, Strain CCCM 725" /LENGTH=592 /DNA_ID=CAMNT_0010903629 /DNA_START=42 /DNA_END=1820 /DNA_ORIENTATION=+
MPAVNEDVGPVPSHSELREAAFPYSASKVDALEADVIKSIDRLEERLKDQLLSIDRKIDTLLCQPGPEAGDRKDTRKHTKGRRVSGLPRPISNGRLSDRTFTGTTTGWEERSRSQSASAVDVMNSLHTRRSSLYRASLLSHKDKVSMFDGGAAGQRSKEKSRRVARKAEIRKSVHRTSKMGAVDKARQSQILSKVERSQNRQSVMAWEFLDNPESSYYADIYAKGMWFFTLVTVCTTLLQTCDPPLLQGLLGGIVEMAIDVIFSAEILVRLAFCPFPQQFFMVVWNWVDLLAALPSLVLRLLLGPFYFDEGDELARMYLLCILPILRLARLLRRFEQFHLLRAAFVDAFEALPVLLFTLVFIVLVTAALMFMVEPRENIPHLPKAIWLSVVTITTVGYGDVVPKSSQGTIITCVMVICSVLYMAMPLGIIGSAFCNIWNDRDRILLIQRTREQFKRWGFAPPDLPLLFQLVDIDGNGCLEFKEFVELLKQMRIVLTENRMVDLFAALDVDNSGEIDAQEFVKTVFPEAYHAIYGLHQEPEAEETDDDVDVPEATEATQGMLFDKVDAVHFLQPAPVSPEDSTTSCATCTMSC